MATERESDEDIFLTQFDKDDDTIPRRRRLHLFMKDGGGSAGDLTKRFNRLQEIIGHQLLWHDDFIEQLVPRNRHQSTDHFCKFWKIFCYLHINGVDCGDEKSQVMEDVKYILTATNQFEASIWLRMVNLFHSKKWPRNGKRYYAIQFITGKALWIDDLTVCQPWEDNTAWYSGYGFVRIATDDSEFENTPKRRR